MMYDNLKDLIIIKCGSVRNFCEKTDISYQSMTNRYLKGREDLLLPHLEKMAQVLEIDNLQLYEYLKHNERPTSAYNRTTKSHPKKKPVCVRQRKVRKGA